MKILVYSDLHGNVLAMQKVLQQVQKIKSLVLKEKLKTLAMALATALFVMVLFIKIKPLPLLVVEIQH